MPQCTVRVLSIEIIENGDGGAGEWRLNIWVNGQYQSWNQDGVQDGQAYPLNWEFVVDIPDCSESIRLEANGYEEDGGWFLDEHDTVAPLTANLSTRTNAVQHLGASNDDVTYRLEVQVDCPTCRAQPLQAVGGGLLFDPNIGRLVVPQIIVSPPVPPLGGGQREEHQLTERPPIGAHVFGRNDFLEQVRNDFLKRLNKRRAKELYRVPDEPTEADLLRIGIMRMAKSGWELTALDTDNLVFRLTPYGHARREYLRMVQMPRLKRQAGKE